MVSGKTRSTIAMLALMAAGPAAALGLGDVRAQVLLGQPLNLAIPVSLGEGETLSAECAAAEVQVGESRLQPGMVRVRVTQGRDSSEAVIRVQSTVVVDEPVVNVTVSAGCPPRVTRTLVLLADPPLVSPVAAEPARSSAPGPSAGTAPAAEPPSAAQATPQAPAARATRPATPPRAARTAQRRAPEAAVRAATPGTAAAPAARSAAAAAPRPSTPERAGRPRLQLDAPTVAVNPAAVQAAEAQASAAEVHASAARLAAATAEAAASAAQQRLKDVETEMARLRAEAQAQTDALVQLRRQIAQDQAQRQQQSWVNPLLLVATVVMAVLALWIALRSRRQEPLPAQRDVWWDKPGASEPPALDPDEDSVYQASTFKTSARVPLKIPSAPAPLGAREGPPTNIGLDSLLAPPTVAAPMAVTIPPMPPRADDASRAVSVDEQIDLEQQADFFIALGHDESAVDLLMAHLRSTGGGTPLPFLKLLEIHRRRDDREAYERTRVRFNQRFNSVAPEWHSDPGVGRSLEDYPLVVGRIQHAWPRPLDAMAELEALLFRRGAGSEMFDLPAYQEVLFLYQLARDLHQADRPDDADNVDVLLPIGAAAPPAPEGTIVLRPEFNGGEALSLDLDLTTKTGSIDSGVSSAVELDLGGGEREDKPAAEGGDVWSEDPDERRRK
jgi:pilus assembly protein FimV